MCAIGQPSLPLAFLMLSAAVNSLRCRTFFLDTPGIFRYNNPEAMEYWSNGVLGKPVLYRCIVPFPVQPAVWELYWRITRHETADGIV